MKVYIGFVGVLLEYALWVPPSEFPVTDPDAITDPLPGSS
jgi:hypothetical protein